MNEKYWFSFQTAPYNQTCRVGFLFKGYAGPTQNLIPSGVTGGPEPVVLEWASSKGEDERGAAVYGSSATIRICTTAAIRSEAFFSEDKRSIQVQITLNGSLYWAGWLLSQISEEELPYGRLMTLKATDGLKTLADTPFVSQLGKGFDSLMTPQRVLSEALRLTGISLPFGVTDDLIASGTDASTNPLTQCLLHPLAWVDGDGVPNDTRKVLESLSVMRGADVIQSDGRWWFRQVESLKKTMVREWQYDAAAKPAGSASVDHFRSLVAGRALTPEERAEGTLIMVEQGQPRKRIGTSYRQVTVELEYGRLYNRLFNSWFLLTDAALAGGVALRGWRYYSTEGLTIVQSARPSSLDSYASLADSNETPFSQKIFTLLGVANDASKGEAAYAYRADRPGTIPEAFSGDGRFLLSAPILVRYDQKIKLTGQYLQKWAKGARVQLIATPLRNESIVEAIRADPNYPLAYSDEYHEHTMNCLQGHWVSVRKPGKGSYALIPTFEEFTNTEEIRERVRINFAGGQQIVADPFILQAKSEWASFTSEPDPLPNVKDQNIAFHPSLPSIEGSFWLIRVALYRAVAYDPGSQFIGTNTPQISFRNLEIGYFDGLEKVDYRSEKWVLTQPDSVAEVLDTPLKPSHGDSRTANYYSAILGLDGQTLLTKWTRRGAQKPAASLALVGGSHLSTYRKPGYLLDVVLRGKGLSMTNLFTLDLVPLKWFRPLSGRYSIRREEWEMTLAELDPRPAFHTRKHYAVDANGKGNLLDSDTSPGELPSFATPRLRFLDLLPNGRGTDHVVVIGGASFPFPQYLTVITWADAPGQTRWTLLIAPVTLPPSSRPVRLEINTQAKTYAANLPPGTYAATLTNEAGESVEAEFEVTDNPVAVGTVTGTATTTLTVPVKGLKNKQTVTLEVLLPGGGVKVITVTGNGDQEIEYSIAVPEGTPAGPAVVKVTDVKTGKAASLRIAVDPPAPPRIQIHENTFEAAFE